MLDEMPLDMEGIGKTPAVRCLQQNSMKKSHNYSIT